MYTPYAISGLRAGHDRIGNIMIEMFQELKLVITTMSLCIPRLLTAFLISPFFNTDMITGATRNCIVIVFALIVFPTMMPFMNTHDLTVAFVVATSAKEAVIGALIGYMAGLFFHTVAGIGHIIDRQRGAAFASMMDPTTGAESTPMGSLFTQITITLFFTGGGFLLFLSGMYESYRVWPIDSYWPTFDPEFTRFFISTLDDLFALVFLLASPVLITLFLSELCLGLINRFAPQLNVFFLAMPIKSALALAFLIFYLQFILDFIKEGFIQRFDIFDALREVVH